MLIIFSPFPSHDHSEKVKEVEAESPKEAREIAVGFFSDDFQEKATVYVFEQPPVLVTEKR